MKNFFSTLLAPSLVAAAGLAIASSAFTPVRAASLTFDVFDFTGDDAQARLTLDDTGGVVKFTVNNVTPIADIRGVFFNILDNSLLSTLSVTGPNVTDSQFGPAGTVNDLGNGANINPRAFDAGVEIGTQGIGRDDIRSTMFTVSSNAAPLTLAQFYNQEFGLRLTSVGNNRNGSSKLAGTAPGGPSEPVPEPGTIAATGLFAAGFRLLKKKKAIAQG